MIGIFRRTPTREADMSLMDEDWSHQLHKMLFISLVNLHLQRSDRRTPSPSI